MHILYVKNINAMAKFKLKYKKHRQISVIIKSNLNETITCSTYLNRDIALGFIVKFRNFSTSMYIVKEVRLALEFSKTALKVLGNISV